MTVAAARLEADGFAPFDLTPDEGFAVATLDLGFPAVRAVTESRPDADGENDTTARIGARAVVLIGTVLPTTTLTRQQVLDRLRSFLRPSVRPWLVFRLEVDGDERRIRLRGDQNSAPVSHPGSVQVTVGWRGPDGIQESTVESAATLEATADVEAGRSYPLTFNRVYPASAPIGSATVTNDGNIDVYPRLRLYGPVTGPAIENQTVGRTLEFPGLVVAAGDYVEIDTRTRTVRLLGDVDQSRHSFLDFDVSAWWSLAPGDNDLRYYPSVFGAGAQADILFRSAWL